MERVTITRRGRPPKSLGHVETNRETGSDTPHDNGNRQVGTIRIGPQEDALRTSARTDWVAFNDFLRTLPDSRLITAVWFPHPRQKFIRLLNGRQAPTFVGESAYQIEDIVRI